jgi:hypothetical protein
MIVQQIREYLLKNAPERKIADLRIGLIYTGVLLDDGNAGVAYTFSENFLDCHSFFAGIRPLKGRSTHEVLRCLGSSNMVEASVGIATANALINHEKEEKQGGDILDVLELRETDCVGMVGAFVPMISLLKARVGELLIFELHDRPAEGVLSAEKAFHELPRCDVALITSTSLINGTMDLLVEAAVKGCRDVVLLGPSTPLIPEIFKPLGVTMLAGLIITDPPCILQVVSEGGGMRAFGDCVKKVNIKIG